MQKDFIVNNFIKSLHGGRLELEVYEEQGGHVKEGLLKEQNGNWYPIINSVPCFLTGPLKPDMEWFKEKHGLSEVAGDVKRKEAEDQRLTNTTFSDKWRRFRNYGLESSHQKFLYDWYRKKLGFSGIPELKEFYRNKKLILEVGPGSGFNSRFMAENTEGHVFSVDVSDAAYTTFENTSHLKNCHVIQADLMDTPFREEFFDFIIADGVLHHTPDTKKAFLSLYRKLKRGGQMFFYVYRKMGAARQFCDQHIRESFSQLEPDSCYEACEALTDLGRELSKLNAEIILQKPIPILGIPAGTHNVQRLFYYNFVKCFWNDAFDYETNNMVNFDWYHPHNAWQHTEEEVESWLTESGIIEYSFNDSNPNGISVLLRKPS
jgi:SAM-dependent methyltransferase/uncharacterized protein YbaR (Trm112 family)